MPSVLSADFFHNEFHISLIYERKYNKNGMNHCLRGTVPETKIKHGLNAISKSLGNFKMTRHLGRPIGS